MLGGGLAIVLLGGVLGLGLVGVTVVLFLYGIFGKNETRGLVASWISVGLSVLAILLSFQFWILTFTGRSTSGEKLDLTGSDFPIMAPVLIEGAVLAATVVGLVRRLRRRGGAGGAAVG